MRTTQEAIDHLLKRAEEYEAQGESGKAELCREAAKLLEKELEK